MRREMTAEWSMENELAAQQLEMTHQHYRATLATGGVKKHRLPKPLSIPRPVPWKPEESPPPGKPPPPRGRRHASTVEEVVAVVRAGFGPSRG